MTKRLPRPDVALPRSEVISLRVSAARLELLERYRRVLAGELGRDVSLSEAAFLALEDREPDMERAATRAELLKTPTESLYRIRRQWERQHALSAAQWDVLVEYVLVGAEEDRHDPPLQPAIPSRDSYIALLDAFRSVYERRLDPISRHAWAYFGNLGGSFRTPDAISDLAPDQQVQLLLKQVEDQRERLVAADRWERPGNIGHCLWVAVREEGVDSTTLDHVLAPHWAVLWRLAARGHWIRHAHRPVRMAGSREGSRLAGVVLPEPMSADDFVISFGSAVGGDLIVSIASRSRRFSLDITRYPELTEFRMLLETTADRSIGAYYSMTVEPKPARLRRIHLTRRRVSLEFSNAEWIALRDLLRRAREIPAIQCRLAALQLEYGEHG